MHQFDFTASSFDPAGSGACHLSLCCGSDGLTLLIHDLSAEQLLVCRHYPFTSSGYQLLLRKIREIISREEIFKLSFGKTTIFLGEKQLTLVPESLYTPRMAEMLFPPVKKHDSGLETVVVPVPETAAYLLFRTGKDVYDYLSLTFPGAEFRHELNPLLHLPEGQESILFFHLHDSWFYAVAKEHGKLLMANSYEFRSPNDLLYYALAVSREFNPENHPVVLSGWIAADDSRLETLRKYIPGLEWAGDMNTLQESGEDRSFRSFYGLFRR
ncbi:MAG TPA: DUF3822 family protein [Prolixibacteraceae bacterium]|nr:DUF3822 family protein [Prolixibacteraceae bacterium]